MSYYYNMSYLGDDRPRNKLNQAALQEIAYEHVPPDKLYRNEKQYMWMRKGCTFKRNEFINAGNLYFLKGVSDTMRIKS